MHPIENETECVTGCVANRRLTLATHYRIMLELESMLQPALHVKQLAVGD